MKKAFICSAYRGGRGKTTEYDKQLVIVAEKMKGEQG